MPIGRPRTFDKDRAVDCALRIFWQKGYEGASLEDLTKAMHINKPSLYAAFGNKESLFKLVLDRYAQGPGSFVREALGQSTARKVAEHLLKGAIELQTNSKNPAGCLWVHGALACRKENDCVRKELISRRMSGQAMLRKRFERAAKEGDLPRNANPAVLARSISTLINGLAVQAASGASRIQLHQVAQLALSAWPR